MEALCNALEKTINSSNELSCTLQLANYHNPRGHDPIEFTYDLTAVVDDIGCGFLAEACNAKTR